MTRKSILSWLNILLLILAIAVVIYAPFYIASLQDAWYKYLAWFGLICLLLVFLIPISLTPYFGMREIKREIEQKLVSAKAKVDELLPLEQVAKSQRDNPAQFMSARFEHLMVGKNNAWVGSDVIISSRLPYAVTIKTVDVILQVPVGEGSKYKYDMKPCIGEPCGSVSSEAGHHDRKIRVHIDNVAELSGKLLAYIGKHPCKWIPCVEGTVIITTDELKEVRLDIPETSVIATIVEWGSLAR